MRIVFFKKGWTAFDRLMNELYTEVLGEEPRLIHCGFVYNEQLIHLTLDGVVMEEYSALWRRRASIVVVADRDTDIILNSVRLMNRLNYRMTYMDWLRMSFKRPGNNCATFIAEALFMPELARIFLTPDTLLRELTNDVRYDIIPCIDC